MIKTSNPQDDFSVVIAGGGVAALEATLALRHLTGPRPRITLIAPDEDFVYRPMTVREPFAYAAARRYELAGIADDLGVDLVHDRIGWVDAERRVAHTEGGATIAYDALLLAVGTRPYERFAHAVTIDDRHMDELLHGLIQDVEGGYAKRLAFVAPPRMAWPLPLYELALMTAGRAYDMGVDVSITVATPEDAPLAIFGLGASHAVGRLLDDAGIDTISNAYVEVPQSRELVVYPGARRLEFDRIVALPELMGPSIRGLPVGEHGFIPVTPYGQVRGLSAVYAAGDATDFPIKHGGIAAQQADTAAASIAALAGAPVVAEPFHPIIRGVLLTGDKPRYLTAHIVGGHGFSSEISDQPTWSPPTKIAARHLAPYLDERDRMAVAAR
jgi:sulfide:quinone oxidoreductase